MYQSKHSECICAYEARKRMHRISKKRRYAKRKYVHKVRRCQPVCIACHVKFKDIRLFDYHLKSDEHKLNDAPLAFILQRVEKSAVDGGAPEYRIVRRRINHQDSEESNDAEQPMDISSVPIGAECISRVEVSFCQLCKSYIPHETGQEGVHAHLNSLEHLTRMNAAHLHPR